MNQDELNKLLDLEGGSLPSLGSESTPKAPEASPTALKLDQWSLRKGNELLAESPRLRKLNLSAACVSDLHAAAFYLTMSLLSLAAIHCASSLFKSC